MAVSNNLINNKTIIEKAVRDLWQGKGADINMLNGVLAEVSDEILCIANNMNEEDRLTTINYIRTALTDFQRACDNRDDYMLADCLMYEWNDMISIFISESQEG